MAYQFKGFKATRPRARLYDRAAHTWEAFFVYYLPCGKKINYRVKKGINSMPRNARKAEAEETARAMWDALQAGWDPTVQKYPTFSLQPLVERPTFAVALQSALELKKPHLSKYSVYDYAATVRFFTAAAQKAGYGSTRIDQIHRRDIRMIVDTAKAVRSWSCKARNKYLTLLKSLLSTVCDELELIPFNPASRIKNEPEESSLGYRRLTAEEKQRIASHLSVCAPDFLNYLMFIYDDGIRRKEALMLQVKDVDMARREIIIRPSVSKTNIARIVPITATIFAILEAMKIKTLPREWYLFSSNKFKPGPRGYHPNTPTSWWKNLVQKGLNIDCKMYGLKHTGADDKIAANIPLDALRNLYGHQSQQMTEIYARSVRNMYLAQIIEKSPVFGK